MARYAFGQIDCDLHSLAYFFDFVSLPLRFALTDSE